MFVRNGALRGIPGLMAFSANVPVKNSPFMEQPWHEESQAAGTFGRKYGREKKMRTEDHVLLAETLIRNLNIPDYKKKAFIKANAVPDYEPHTYLGNNVRYFGQGHSYPVRIRGLIRFLNKKPGKSVFWWFRFGLQIHYLTDFFSKPHNPQFGYKSRDHVAYEIEQHRMFPAMVQHNPWNTPQIRGEIGLWLMDRHREYMKRIRELSKDEEGNSTAERACMETDGRYAVTTVMAVWEWEINRMYSA